MRERSAFISIIVLGIVAGLTGFLFLFVINYFIGLIIADEYKYFNWTYALVALLIIVLNVWAKKALASTIISFSQKNFWSIRAEVIFAILDSGYEQVNAQKEQLYSVLTQDVAILTQGSLNVIQFLTSLVLMSACLVYMAISSFPLFLVVLGTAIAGALVYLFRSGSNSKKFAMVRELETGFVKYFNSLLGGSKEIHINPAIGSEIYREKITPIAKEAYRINTSAYTGFLNNQVIGQVLFYMLVASILLFFSNRLSISKATVISFVFLLQYLLGALESVMVLLPSLAQANVSRKKIRRLREDLAFKERISSPRSGNRMLEPFKNLIITDLQFEYSKENRESSFQLGPLNLSVEQGEIVFIYGGNGSGKTTFIYLLLGLTGNDLKGISLNGRVLEVHEYESYKSVFGVVFNDYYLFEELFGISVIDEEKARQYLALFEIDEKVTIREKRFSTIQLSAGQRKRLALIAILLQDNPVLVIDEWASDQDPYFRRKFYTEILPYLKEEGKTIIAITHDDAYYHLCDKLYKMEEGRLHIRHKSGQQQLA